MDEILKAREARYQQISALSGESPIVSVKANIPGADKNVPMASFLIYLFKKLLKERFPAEDLGTFASADGPYQLLKIKEDSVALKRKLITIETNHPLGRLIDLDCYQQENRNLSRYGMKEPLRKCLLCDHDALYCIKNRTHSVADLHEKMHRMIADYLKQEMKILIDEALTTEAKLEDKFGLVTLTSRGSHPDMDYTLFEKSKQAILEYLSEMVSLGYLLSPDDAFPKAKAVGMAAEREMYVATGGINTYKGLIFVLGITLTALGICFRNQDNRLFEKIAYLAKNLDRDFETLPETFGKEAYHRFGIRGIRGEAADGLVHVRNILPLLKTIDEASLHMALMALIASTEDTVLLKRAGSIEKYEKYRKLIGSVKEYDPKKIRELTEECIREHLSFGGSADLLATAVLIRKVEEKFNINYE